MSEGSTGIAILGCAHIHLPHYLGGIAARSDMTLTAVMDEDPVLAAATAEQARTVVRTVDEIVKDPLVDAVIVCSQTARHGSLIKAAVSAGKHLFVEKPLATSGAEAKLLAAEIGASPILFQIEYFMRELEAYRLARTLVHSGKLGTVTRARISVLHNGANERWFDDYRWMLDEKEAGFGNFGDLAVHALDLLLGIFGAGITSVTASLGHLPGAQGSLDHFGEGFLRYANGMIASVAASAVDAASPITMELHGTKGVVLVQAGRLNAYGFEIEVEQDVRSNTPMDSLDLLLDAVNGNQSAIGRLVDPISAAQSVVLVDALYQAAHAGRWIDATL